MHLLVLQCAPSGLWLLTLDGNYVRMFDTLLEALTWLTHNPDGWSGNTATAIVGTLASVTA